MGPFASLFKSNARKKGSEAVEKALAGFEEIIVDLSKALADTNEEAIEAEDLIRIAEQERDRIKDTLKRGEMFSRGLKALLQG